MDTIFMNSKNSKTSEPHVLMNKLTDKLDLTSGEESITLPNLGIYYKWKNIKSSQNNNTFKKSAQTWNDKFELPDGTCSVSDIQDFFEHILKKHGKNTDNPSIRIYVHKIENRTIFKIRTGYSFELLTAETMKLLGSTKNTITKEKNGEKYHILKLQQQYQFTVILLILFPNKLFGFSNKFYAVKNI